MDTTHALGSFRVTDISTTLPLVSLLSEASASTSISTGKERDSESGNDYFGARYYASRRVAHPSRFSPPATELDAPFMASAKAGDMGGKARTDSAVAVPHLR